MPTASEAIDAAINEVTAARNRVAKVKANQVRGVDDIASLKATAQTWFHTHRTTATAGAPNVDFAVVNAGYQTVLDATAKYAAKKTYLSALKDIKLALLAVRAEVLFAPITLPASNTDDLAPDFSPLAGNPQMRDILTGRWNECAKCVKAEAHLAAIVMMGGLLEALFVARANKMPDKSALTSATSAPKDKTTGKSTNYQDWMLDAYIKVGFELKWITESARDVAHNLKEYRNFVHPAKELRYGVSLGHNDSAIFWQVTKALTRQLLLSA